MRNILFVVDEKQIGGVSTLLEDILNGMNISKYSIDVLVLHNNGDGLKNLPKDVNIIYGTEFFNTIDLTTKEVIKTKNPKLLFSKARIVLAMKTGSIKKYIVRERKKIISKKYDVEISFKDGFTALFTAYGNSNKKIQWLHTDYSMYDCTAKYKKLFNIVFNTFDKIIAISKPVADKFSDVYPGHKVEVIYNIVDQKKIRTRAKEKTSILLDKKKLNFVSVGRMHYMKGYDRLIEVINKINLTIGLDDVCFTLIGDGPDFTMIKNLVNKYNLNDKVKLTGMLSNPFPILKQGDCFIMCSRYEPFGLVVIESLTLGVPVLACKEATMDEMLNKKTGIIVENNEKSLYTGIVDILNNPDQIMKLKDNLKNYKYDVEKIYEEIEKLFNI